MTTPAPWIVTGAAGFLGSHVVEQLVARGEHVVALDNLAWGKMEYLKPYMSAEGFFFAEADIRDQAAIDALVAEHRPGAIIHLAALHFIPEAIKNPGLAVSVNVHGTQVLLSSAMKSKVRRFWLASTGDVYAPSEQPHKETETPSPFNIYGLSKYLAEQLAALAQRQSPSMCVVTGRLMNLFGARETNPHILPEICRQLRERPQGPLYLGNVSPYREMVPVEEAARCVIETMDQATSGHHVVNIATGVSRTISELISMISQILGRELLVVTDPDRVRSVERARLTADVSKLQKLLGWVPSSDLVPFLRRMLAYEGVR